MANSTWLISESDLPQGNADVLSTLFCVGNGATTTRGTFPEQRLEAYRGTYVSGLYTKAGYGLIYFMVAPDWLPAFIENSPITSSDRVLDIHDGVLRRTAVTGNARFTEARFASFADSRLMCQRITLEASQPVTFVMGIDGDVRNHRAKYYKPGQFPNSDEFGLKLSAIETISAAASKLHVAVKSRSTDARAAITAHVGRPRAGEVATPARQVRVRESLRAQWRSR